MSIYNGPQIMTRPRFSRLHISAQVVGIGRTIIDSLRKVRIVSGEAVLAFRRNNDLTIVSSLAFSSTIALIPALFLITYVLGSAIGSSQEALAKVQTVLRQVIPTYSQEILREVRFIADNRGTIGIVNFAILLLSVMPLVADLRTVLGTIFRAAPSRHFLLEKLIDAGLTIIFMVGLLVIALIGVSVTMLQKWAPLTAVPAYVGGLAPFLFVVGIVYLLYLAFSRKVASRYLLAGAVVTASLWFAMRPLFHLFLAYNPGYGFAFGSFKSLFVVVIWIYYSLLVFLLGAEIAAVLNRRRMIYLKRMIEGQNVPKTALPGSIVRYAQGSVIFSEGETGDRIYSVLRGRVGIRKGDREIAEATQGGYFGVASFLLETPRIASAVALEDTELIVITRDNIGHLMTESPKMVLAMLKDIAARQREANRLIE